MKKMILAIFLFFSFLLVVSAENFALSDLNMNLTFSSSWVVFTKENYKGNAKLKDFGLTEEMMEKNFDPESTYPVYVDAVAADGMELFVRATTSDLKRNLMSYKDSDLDTFAKTLKEKTGSTSHKITTSHDIKWILVDYQDKNNDFYVMEAYTIVDQKAITITGQYQDKFTLNQQKEFHNVLNSITIKFKDSSWNGEKENSTIIYVVLIFIVCGIGVGKMYYSKKKKL